MKQLFLIIFCLLLTGCATLPEETAQTTVSTESTAVLATEAPAEETARKILPLPDTTMDEVDNAILSVSLEEGDAYVDDTGKMQMDLTIYTYDRYDMVDIASLAVGDTIVTHHGDVEITSLERNEDSTIYINGGFDNDGMDLVTDEGGVYFQRGYSDHKIWYEVGEVTLRVSTDLQFYDHADPDAGEVIYYSGSFLIGEVANYDFTPYNTTVRVEGGQIMEMNRRYIP